MPDSCKQAWSWFVDLSSTRTSNGFGYNPLQYSEILAYFALMDIEPNEWEIKLIKHFDIAYLKHLAKEAEEREKKKT